MNRAESVSPQPFLKWPGGKRQLLPELLSIVDSLQDISRYHEPFLGGGALFFALTQARRLSKNTHLADINPNLMDAYIGVRDEVESVIEQLLKHKQKHCEKYFYKVRTQRPRKLANRAARIIYLNRTCFNGLYRENSKGQFNAPLGRYKNPRICDADNLRACAQALKATRLAVKSFEASVRLAKPGDLVYFDPPYAPVSKTADFTAYAKGGFSAVDQAKLAEVFAALAARGVHAMLSNSLTNMTANLYKDFHIYRVYATRRINSKADRRGKVPEVLVTSFAVSNRRQS